MDCIKSNNHLVNTLLFPGSIMISSYDTETFINNYSSDFDPDELHILYIPFISTKLLNVCNQPKYIPCLLKIARKNAGSTFVIHMHGNACDVNHISMCATRESYSLNCHYLIVEYPGYGICEGSPSQSLIDDMLYVVYDFVINQLRVPTHKVVLIGRSIGTGPVTKLAAVLQIEKRSVAAVILQSPYTSLRNAASDLVGTCISSSCMIERWENWKILAGKDQSSLACPVLLIHADQDQIIDVYHSESMHAARLKLGLPSTLYIQKSTYDFIKGHNHYDYDTDVIVPSRDFLAKYVHHSGLWPINLDKVKQYIIRPYDFPKFDMNKSKIWTISNCIRWSYCPCIACCESMTALTCNICNNCDNNDGFQYQPKSQRKLNTDPLINTEKVKKFIKTGSIRSLDVDNNKEDRATINPILHETIIFDNDKKNGAPVIEFVPG